MQYRKPRRAWFRAACCIAAVALSACGTSPSPNPPSAPGTYPVAPQFRAFYDLRGGADVLGPAITVDYDSGDLTLQYTRSALMMFDPSKSGAARYSLAPLGRELGFYEPPNNPNPNQPLQIGDYATDAAIKLLYHALGGEEVVGKPLTNLRMNLRHNRMEQHFENLGLARYLDDPTAPPFLLAYGDLDCKQGCPYEPPSDMIFDFETLLPQVFEDNRQRIGPDLLGDYLAGPFDLADGGQEVIFQNMVMVTQPDIPGRIFGRPIVTMVGVEPDTLVPRMDSEFVVFFALEDGLGHNIPKIFYDFIAAHGGLDIAGFPITEMHEVSDGVYQQCFENLCLDYDNNRPPGFQIQAQPLGQEYKNRFYNNFESGEEIGPATLHLWEARSPVTSQEDQTLFVIVRADGAGLEGAQPRLTVFFPDGSMIHDVFPPTDEQGKTAYRLPPVKAKNGSWINYTVCFAFPGGEVCANEQYYLWGNAGN